MVAITHNAGNSEKVEAILAAAQKRLGRYGFEKTTMAEIASDVNLSKASLYYYFPDKESIWYAILDKEQDEFFRLMNSRLLESHDPKVIISEFVKLRHDYITTFVNLTKFRFTDRDENRPLFQGMICKFRAREEQQVAEILKQGNKTGVFEVDQPEKTARLFLDILHGLRKVAVRNRPMMELVKEDYDLMFEKQKDFLELFMRSIKK